MKLQSEELLLASSDPILEKIIGKIPKPTIASTKNVFHDIMSCVIEQQIHYRSTKKIFQKQLNGSNLEYLDVNNFQHFEKISLATTKLSINKYQTIVSVFEYFKSDTTEWQTLSDEEVILKLSTIKGIGKWTIDMILLYTLERPNIFPYDDFHLKQIMVTHYGLNPNQKLKFQMIEVSENWQNQKSLAVKYLLSWKEHNKKTN
jgi:DNA-3-methyladenine glycosylase II